MNSYQSNIVHNPEYQKLSVCITFHYAEERLQYLAIVCDKLVDIAPEVHLTIVTNTDKSDEIQAIKGVINVHKFEFNFLIPVGLGHPYLLAWSHLPVFKKQFEDESFTHFLYLEDDIGINLENINYWLNARKLLKPLGFYPSFFRKELNSADNNWYSTDVMTKMSLYDCPSIDIDETNSFIGIVYPYQGMYLLDRELLKEHLYGPSSNPDCEHNNTGLLRIHPPQIREKAALCLTYMSVPEGFRSRNLLPFDKNNRQIKSYAMIDHLPNNYTNNPNHSIGKIKVTDLFIPRSLKTFFRKKIKLTFASLLSALFSFRS